ncbi:hypothetical protein M9Y10_028444 [Tritrichomonas musculus]|uniref:Kri1-like C-terminal domain-containing protein n=1 Tax=Tritrichomonas musculus TaxID=1915356 RepID=A0ABR2KK39_9EUKA
MSEYSEYEEESSDENGEELTIEEERAIDVALAKAIKGDGFNNEDISVTNEYVESHNKEDKTRLLNESVEALKEIASHDPKDETNAFLLDYFSQRKWDKKQKKPTKEELDADNDLDDVVEAFTVEENYNFRHEEQNFDIIPSNPRFVEGEDRNRETNRQRKRREAAEQARENTELIEKKLDEIDQKYEKIAKENENGKLTNEQLHQYADEYSAVLREEQGGAFNYTEVKTDGGIEKSIKILEDDNDNEEDANDRNVEYDEEQNDSKPNMRKNDKNKPRRNKFNKNHGNAFHGKFDKNRKKRHGGPSASRMSTYEAHRH